MNRKEKLLRWDTKKLEIEKLLVSKWILLAAKNERPTPLLKQLRELGMVTEDNSPTTKAYREGVAEVISGMPFWNINGWKSYKLRYFNKEVVDLRRI